MVVARAVEAGVRSIVNPGVDMASSRQALLLAERFPEVHAAVGVHPNECESFDESTLKELRELALHPKVVAIGEIGLDNHWKRVSLDRQEKALRSQLELAAELGLPVILHSRQSNSELLRVLGQSRLLASAGRADDAIAGVWHAFSGDYDQALAAYALGMALGLGGPVTFRNAEPLRLLVPRLRRDRLMLETDAPYLAPAPFRGQRNEPAHLPRIAEALAALCEVPTEAVTGASDDAIGRCFGLGSDPPGRRASG